MIVVGRDFRSRPTTDFAREALFNILANHFDFDTIRLLDLFAGTGSISLEFSSRGCRDIDLVDFDSHFIRSVGKAADALNIATLHPVKMDVFRFLQICKKQYDVIFADPPYELGSLPDIPRAVLEKNLLLPGGWFILEHARKYSFSTYPSFFDERKYGNVHFSFFHDLKEKQYPDKSGNDSPETSQDI
jgi:16S rRNA (guanine(966)-N(2))-methyltransferase RsmD